VQLLLPLGLPACPLLLFLLLLLLLLLLGLPACQL
jgi:hypothetical protein